MPTTIFCPNFAPRETFNKFRAQPYASSESLVKYNGVLAAPVMAVVMLIASNPKIMGTLTLSRTMKAIGWLATAVMLIASIAFFALGA